MPIYIYEKNYEKAKEKKKRIYWGRSSPKGQCRLPSNTFSFPSQSSRRWADCKWHCNNWRRMISNFTALAPRVASTYSNRSSGSSSSSQGNRVVAIKPFLTLIPIRDIRCCWEGKGGGGAGWCRLSIYSMS